MRISKKLIILLVYFLLFSWHARAETLSLQEYTGPECGVDVVAERASACGVERYNMGNGASCGSYEVTVNDGRCPVAAYKSARTEHCGVELYKSGKDFVCGEDFHEFWTDWGAGGCPGSFNLSIGLLSSIVSNNTETRVHRDGWKVYTQTRYRCRGRTPKSCRNAKFGIEKYRQCAHAQHGVGSYQSCNVFGGYNTCEHADFGIAAYKVCEISKIRSCAVYFKPEQLLGYVTAQQIHVQKTIENLINWSNTFFKVEGDVKNLGCLMQNVVANSGFVGDLVFDATVLDGLKASYKGLAGKEFELGDFPASTCENPLKDITNYICAPTDTSTICMAKSAYINVIADAKTQLANYQLLSNDAVVKNHSDTWQLVNQWTSALEKIVAQAEIPKE